VASSQRIIAVDIGSCNLKLAEFSVDSSGGLTLLNYGVQDLGLDPNKEQERFPFIVSALTEVMKQTGIKPTGAACCVGGQHVFTRFVKLPPVSPDQLNQMIGFEAQQNVPFPIHEVVWDYQILSGGQNKEYEAVIAAVKGDSVEETRTALMTNKITLRTMDVAPLTVINSFRYNYPNHEGCALVVDIGAKTTSLVFSEEGRVFCRVLPIAGYQISQNISNEFQEPYIAAETLKKGKGFVGLGGAYQDPDDAAAARISKISRTVFSRLHAEITRSISFYRNQQGGSAPKAIYLTGGTAAMPYADRFFAEKLSVPVQVLNPLLAVQVSPTLDRSKLATDVVYFAALVGLALRQAGNCPVEVNLLPQSIKKDLDVQGRMPYLILALSVWVLAFLILGGSNLWQSLQVEKESAVLKADVENKQLLSKKIQKASAELNQLTQEVETLARIKQQRDFWPRLLDVLNEKVPVGVWIAKLEVTNGAASIEIPSAAPAAPAGPSRGPAAAAAATPEVLNLAPSGTEVRIQGYYEDQIDGSEVNKFVEQLKQTGLFEQVSIPERESPNGDLIALRFTIVGKLKADQTLDLKP